MLILTLLKSSFCDDYLPIDLISFQKGEKFKFDDKNPFISEDDDTHVASVAYRLVRAGKVFMSWMCKATIFMGSR